MFRFLHDLSIVKSHLFVKHYAFILNQGYAYKGKLLYQRFNTLNEKKITGLFIWLQNNKQVVNLDDGQLRALLDEAMNYKCPKDLEGKSNLFKV